MKEGTTRSRCLDDCQRPVQLLDHFDLFEMARRVAARDGRQLRYQEFISLTREQQLSACVAKNEGK